MRLRLALVAALTVTACDSGPVDPDRPAPEPEATAAAGAFTALLNGEPYEAPSEYWARDGQFKLAARITDSTSYYYQYVTVKVDAEDVEPGRTYRLRSGTEDGAPNRTWAAELDGDALLEYYRLDPSETAELVVTSVDRAANEFRAEFRATYVGDRPGDGEFNRWPDTLRFTEGRFVSPLVPEK